jgi:glucan phosphoethanolaminetransferase (alkaline phosphatase superfamily)
VSHNANRATEENFELHPLNILISIFNKHNFTTAWISYQDVLDNSYSNIAPLANEAHYKIQMDLHPQAKSKFQIDRGKMLDEVMIPEMEKL